MENKMLLSYYGDDFTGSTDVMEALAINGIPTALFLKTPSPDEVANFSFKNKNLAGKDGKLKAFGVAGISRSLTPDQMDEELPPIFEKISRIPTKFFHYKVCSTFDSSPHLGNIGHATDLAFEFFPSNYIPLIVGAPSINRFSVFGNLFAKVGETTYRLDRHPTMSKHPVTPMHEADLRLHIAKQTYRNTALMDIFALELPEEERKQKFLSLHKESGEYVLFDILNKDHLLKVGQLIAESAGNPSQLLVGSSGIEYAICAYLQQQKIITKPEVNTSVGEADQILIMSGSASPVTQVQIEWIQNLGFVGIRINTLNLANPQASNEEINNVKTAAKEAINEGKSVVIYSVLGPEDPAIEATKDYIQKHSDEKSISAILAVAQGQIMKGLLEETGIRRAAVAGGDTSGYVARSLGIYALETMVPIAPGAPLCLAHSYQHIFDGLQIVLKGGQNGNERFFESVLKGELLL
ncbi:MAG: four-carbon acid sugar kinase family protein [Bacteroidota bacterium]